MQLADLPILAALRQIQSMPRAEIVSRKGAVDDLKAVVGRAIVALKADRTTSDEVATLASGIMKTELSDIGPASQEGAKMSLATFHHWAQTVAGSALAQADGPEIDPNQSALPLDDVSARALGDAISGGQAKPMTETVVIGDGSTGIHESDDNDA